MRIFLLLFISLFASQASCQKKTRSSIDISQRQVVDAINDLRAEGCKCGNKYYKPAERIEWNDKLVESALIQAKMMKKYNVFKHIGPDGKDVADKMEMVGYNWHFAGENLAEGQDTFFEALKDWKKSKTHCELLMDPRMEHIGLVKYHKYWVLHLGKELPKNAKRVTERYIEN